MNNPMELLLDEMLREFLRYEDPGLAFLAFSSARWTKANEDRDAGKEGVHAKFRGYGVDPYKMRNILENMLRGAKGRFVGSLKKKGRTDQFRSLPLPMRTHDLLKRFEQVGHKIALQGLVAA